MILRGSPRLGRKTGVHGTETREVHLHPVLQCRGAAFVDQADSQLTQCAQVVQFQPIYMTGGARRRVSGEVKQVVEEDSVVPEQNFEGFAGTFAIIPGVDGDGQCRPGKEPRMPGFAASPSGCR